MELLAVNGLNISIGNSQKIQNVSFVVESGDVVLLTGPNGCGKSTLIKVMLGDVFEYSGLTSSAESVLFLSQYRILQSEGDSEYFRKHICYVSQDDTFESESVLDCFLMAINYEIKKNQEKYVFDFVTEFDVQDSFGFDYSETQLDRKGRSIAKKLGLDVGKMSEKERKAVKYLAMSIRKMIRYKFCNMLLLDEPLNNLDYSNVRSFSNILTKIYNKKPELGIIMVTHCRSIPIINRVLEINPIEKNVTEVSGYSCNSCFGKINSEGYYC